MRFEKVILILKKLSSAERKHLESYLLSPYFNVPETAVALHQYLSGIHQSFAEKSLTLEAISRAQPRLGTKAIQDKAGSLLLDAIENFIAQECFQKKPYQLDLCRIAGLKEKHLFQQSEKHQQSLRQLLQASPHQSVNDFETMHLLTEIEESHFDKQQIGKSLGNIEQIIETLDIYHAIKKMRYVIELLNRQAWQQVAIPTDTLQPLIRLLLPYDNEAHPYVYLFLKIYRLYTDKDAATLTEEYNKIYDYLLKHKNDPLTQTYREIIEYASAHLILSINQGELHHAQRYLNLIDLKKHHGLLLKQQHIPPPVYRNTITIATYTGHSQAWIKQFIDYYTPHLPTEQQTHNHHYAQGLLAFSLHHFADAARHFVEVRDPDNFIINAIAKRWYFMSAYEHWKNRERPRHCMLDNFRKYLDNHKDQLKLAIPPSKQFIYYANLLLKSSTQKEKRPCTLQLNRSYFPGKDWLLEKMKEK
jgi:hypothetical protein